MKGSLLLAISKDKKQISIAYNEVLAASHMWSCCIQVAAIYSGCRQVRECSWSLEVQVPMLTSVVVANVMASFMLTLENPMPSPRYIEPSTRAYKSRLCSIMAVRILGQLPPLTCDMLRLK